MQILGKLFTIFVALVGILFTLFGGLTILQSNTTTFVTVLGLFFSLFLGGSISVIGYCIFTGKCKAKKAKPYISKESQELMKTLALVDISRLNGQKLVVFSLNLLFPKKTQC